MAFFDAATLSNFETIEVDGKFSIPFYKWLLANSSPENRQRITNILLHPHVRPLQVRAALGRHNRSSLYADLPFEQLETTAPNVAVVYFLNGRCHVNANGLHQDIVYVGQAAGRAVQKDGEGRGAAKRLGNQRAHHWAFEGSEGVEHEDTASVL